MSELPSFFCNRKKLESHKNVENKDFCSVTMPSEGTKILESNQYQKPEKSPFVVYAYLECIPEKIDGCKNSKSKRTYSITFFNFYNIVI